MSQLDERVARFKADGFMVFRRLIDVEQVSSLWRLREREVGEQMFICGIKESPGVLGNLLERAPSLILPIVSHPDLLTFAERVMGPFVQLDAVVINADHHDPSAPVGKPRSWHRDRFGNVPPEGVYLRPLTMVVLAYMQPMTPEFGPLHIVPGSHAMPMLMTKAEARGDVNGQQTLPLEPGDAVVLHHNLLHSAGHNTSGHDRCFLGFVYNLNGMNQEDNFSGPCCQALIDRARRTNDRRLRRLLGDAKEFVVARQMRGGFLAPDEEAWARWIAEDDQVPVGVIGRSG